MTEVIHLPRPSAKVQLSRPVVHSASARDQVERIARTEHNGHPAEERVLGVTLAAADHEDAERDDCAQIGGIKKRFNNCLHSLVSFFVLECCFLFAAAMAALTN